MHIHIVYFIYITRVLLLNQNYSRSYYLKFFARIKKRQSKMSLSIIHAIEMRRGPYAVRAIYNVSPGRAPVDDGMGAHSHSAAAQSSITITPLQG